MRVAALGSLSVSRVGVGCNQFGVTLDEKGTAAVVSVALEEGANLFDTADEYGHGAAEELLGRALRGKRNEALIATKVGCAMPGAPGSGGAGPAWIARAVDASLQRLQTDYIDLYQVHYPDPSVPVSETLGALTLLIQAGKIREIGCANFTAEMIDDAAHTARDRRLAAFASTQTHLNLIRQKSLATVVPACERRGMRILPYWPLASGLLAGKYRPGSPPPAGSRMDRYPDAAQRMLTGQNFTRLEQLQQLAREHGRSLLELGIAWLLAIPAVACVIAGATVPHQVRVNVAAAGHDWLTGEVFARATEIGAS